MSTPNQSGHVVFRKEKQQSLETLKCTHFKTVCLNIVKIEKQKKYKSHTCFNAVELRFIMGLSRGTLTKKIF